MSIQLKNISFEWPNGDLVFRDLNFQWNPGEKLGLVGPNGVGKSTLGRILQGTLAPSAGARQASGRVASFAQNEDRPSLSVDEWIGDLWSRIDPRDVDVAAILQAGLDFGSACSSLSGGEWTRARLLRELASDADFLLLDEPTNNLDREARAAMLEFVRRTGKGLLVISHDRELLEEVDTILELSNQGLQTYGGNWSFFETARDQERERARGNLDRAKAEKDRSKRERLEKVASQEKRMRQAEKSAPNLGLPKILLGARKRRAEQTLGRVRHSVDEAVEKQVQSAQEAYEALKEVPLIYADFPETEVPAGKLIFEAQDFNFRFASATNDLWTDNISFVLKGPARLSIAGANGAGKTTFLRLLLGERLPGETRGEIQLGQITHAVLDQDVSLLDPRRSVFENVDASSHKSVAELRNLLAQFLFPAEKADQLAGTLSGGERLRAGLAKVLLSDPAPQLLVLDEPTNNLDLPNLEFLGTALAKFRGALVVISHDARFLEELGLTAELRLR